MRHLLHPFYSNSIAIVALALTSCAPTPPGGMSSVVPPDAVQQAFAKQYPGMTPTWQTKPYGYEAVFMQNGLETEAEYNAAGQWLETEVEVGEAAFSQVVLDRIRQQYPQHTITKYEIETTPNGKFYEVEITLAGQELELYFNENAKPITNLYEDS